MMEEGTLFESISTGDFSQLEKCSADDLQRFLPYLVRISASDSSCNELIYSAIINIPKLVTATEYLNEVNYKEIMEAIDNELALKRKLTSTENPSEGSLVFQLGNDQVIKEFEGSSHTRRVRILASELCNSITFAKNFWKSDSLQSAKTFDSNILCNDLYCEELRIIIPTILAKCHSLLSITDTVLALLCLSNPNNSTELILSLVCNFPIHYDQIISTLFQYADSVKTTGDIFLRVAQLSWRAAYEIRSNLVERKMLVPVAFAITTQFIHDEREFIRMIMRNDYPWLQTWLQGSEESAMKTIAPLRDSLILLVEEYLPQKPRLNVELSMILDALCGLVGITGFQLPSQDVEKILRLISQYSTVAKAATLGLCFIVSCKNLTKLCDTQLITECLTSLLHANAITELMLTFAVYFHTNRINSVVDLVRSTTGYSASIHSTSLTSMTEIFTQILFTEEVVARSGSSLPLSSNLSSKSGEIMSLMCVHQLLSSKLFNKHKIDMNQWIFDQLKEVKAPIHPTMVRILEEYALCATPTQSQWCMKPFTETQISNVFSEKNDTSKPIQVLLLYFILYYNDQVFKQREEKSKGNGFTAEKGYTRERVDSIQIKNLLSYVQNHKDDYREVYPPLLGLTVQFYPQLFNVVNLLQEEELETSTIKQFVDTPSLLYTSPNTTHVVDSEADPKSFEPLYKQAVDASQIQDAFKDPVNKPVPAVLMLEQLTKLLPDTLWEYVNSILENLVQHLLNPTLDHGILRQFQILWEGLYAKYPWELGLKMFNLLQPPEMGSGSYSNEELIGDPLLLLRVDERVFINPILMQMFLQILNSYMIASRRNLQNQAQATRKFEESNTLSLAIDSAIVQQLLELCLPSKESKELSGSIENIQILICSFLHELFIENPLMIKLVHFQGYNPDLLPITVNGIPSMHICLDFIPELLVQPQVEKQIFAVLLAGHLVVRYPIAKSLEVTKVIINRMHKMGRSSSQTPLSNYLDRRENQEPNFLLETLPSLEQFCTAFPQLTEDIVTFLIDISPPNLGSAEHVYRNNPHFCEVVQDTFNAIATRIVPKY